MATRTRATDRRVSAKEIADALRREGLSATAAETHELAAARERREGAIEALRAWLMSLGDVGSPT